MNKQKLVLIAGTGFFLLTLSYIVFDRYAASKEGFVNTAMVFNDFRMKKVLEAEYKKVENMRKNQLDSMEMVLKLIDRRNDLPDKQAILIYKTEEFKQKQQEFEESNTALSQKYNEQIWNQLSQYIKDFGKQQGYDYIYGANGDGNLMYAADKNDITGEITHFVNEQYDGVSN